MTWFSITYFVIIFGNFILGFLVGKDWQKNRNAEELLKNVDEHPEPPTDKVPEPPKSAVLYAKGEQPDERPGTVDESFGNQNDV